MNHLSQRVGVACKNALLLASRGDVWVLVDSTNRIFTIPAPPQDEEGMALRDRQLVGVYNRDATRKEIHDDLWDLIRSRIEGGQ